MRVQHGAQRYRASKQHCKLNSSFCVDPELLFRLCFQEKRVPPLSTDSLSYFLYSDPCIDYLWMQPFKVCVEERYLENVFCC